MAFDMAEDWMQKVVTTCAITTDGQSTGNGSTLPLDMATAMAFPFWPGVTVNVGTGTYAASYVCRASGNPFAPVILSGPAATINGDIELDGDYTNIRDFLLADLDFTDRENSIPPKDALRLQAAHQQVTRCIVHDARECIQGYSGTLEISDCVCFYGGWLEGGQGHGHGIYVSGDIIKLKNCIIFDCFGYGIHVYGESPGTVLRNITIENCISFGAGSLSGQAFSNILVAGASGIYPDHPIIKNNCTYHRGNTGKGIELGSAQTGYDGGTLTGNICVGGQYAAKFGNDFLSLPVVENNQFYAPINGLDPANYPNNTYSSGIPDLVKVYPSEYTSTLAHVAIFNGSSANSVSVDLTAVMGLSVGDSVTVANVQDLFVDIQTLTLDADKKITINMQAINRTVATPQGWSAPTTTFPQFGAFVIQKV